MVVFMDEREEEILSFINHEINEVPFTVDEKIYVDDESFNSRDEVNEIKGYIDTFLDERTPNRFFIMPGLRGVGKSTILYQLYDYLLKDKNVSRKNILFTSADDIYKTLGCDIKKVVDIYLKNKFNATLRTLKEKVFIFIDETQYDKEWALSGKIIYDKSNYIFMIFTGSSAIHLEYNDDAARRLHKNTVAPLSYRHHLKLKYGVELNSISDSLKNLIFTGNVDDAIKDEMEINDILTDTDDYDSMDWDLYFKYGGFPILYDKKSVNEISKELFDISQKVITNDMPHFDKLDSDDLVLANRILIYLSKQQPGEVTNTNLANYFKIPTKKVDNILEFLEKTHLIFHCEAFGGAAASAKKSFKYYFATSSLKYNLAKRIGYSLIDSADYEGILIENLIASNLFNLFNKEYSFTIYYDPTKKKNVDFLIQNALDYPIPIEVGRGKKKKSQIKYAMQKYNAPYGIIVSNSTSKIEKRDNVIYIPIKTFSFL